MVKVKTPLLSFEGTGTIGEHITFQRYPKGVKAYRYKKHADAQSPAQLTQRSYFAEARTIWGLLTPVEKYQWAVAAFPTYISGYHAFLSWYIDEMIIHPFGWLFNDITFDTRVFY